MAPKLSLCFTRHTKKAESNWDLLNRQILEFTKYLYLVFLKTLPRNFQPWQKKITSKTCSRSSSFPPNLRSNDDFCVLARLLSHSQIPWSTLNYTYHTPRELKSQQGGIDMSRFFSFLSIGFSHCVPGKNVIWKWRKAFQFHLLSVIVS